MIFYINGIECKNISHKYALEIRHPELNTPFKIVVYQVIQQDTGEELGWAAAPEIQLRQTTSEKQEYIMANTNPTLEMAVDECLLKMHITKGKEIFYPDFFENEFNRLW